MTSDQFSTVLLVQEMSDEPKTNSERADNTGTTAGRLTTAAANIVWHFAP